MEVLQPLQATLNLVAFLANLIDLNKFNTILVLHDRNHRDQINFIIETVQPRYDVAWILVNNFENTEYWNHAVIEDKTILILTAVQQNNVVPLLMQLYNRKKLSARTKNLIVSSDISKLAIKKLPKIYSGEQINAVFVDSTHAEVKIYAWNPKKGEKSIELNETEFLSSSSGALTNRKYSGVFFDQLNSLNGEQINAMTIYETKNMYNVISKDSVAGIDGTVIRIADMIGEAMESPLRYFVLKRFRIETTISINMFTDYLERTYGTFEPVQLRQFEVITQEKYQLFLMTFMESEINILAGGYANTYDEIYKVYPYGFESDVIIVANNTTITATAIERIFTDPIIYFWMLLIFVFVVFRCGIQWLLESNALNTATKRRRCVVMCQDTVQLSCGVVMNSKLFQSDRYGYTMLAHGATIIPLIAGMFLSGLLYGEYLIHSEVPNIDSIEQLEQSNLTICGVYLNNSRIKNKFLEKQLPESLSLIWSGNTSYAYIIPERWTSVLDTDHLRRNGRPLFHVVKERLGEKYQSISAGQYYLQNPMSKIMIRLLEHGFVNHFERVSKRTTEQRTTEMQSSTLESNSSVAEIGKLQEILIACGIYLVGILCAILVFILELFSKRRGN